MADRTPRQVIDAYVDAMNRADWALLREVLGDGYVEEYPQSGELVRGREHAVKVRSQGPRPAPHEGMSTAAALVVGGEERWALAPNFTAIKVTTGGDTLTALVRAIYPDGPWYVVYIATIANGQIQHATMVFGALFDPPAWRSQWVERMPDRER